MTRRVSSASTSSILALASTDQDRLASFRCAGDGEPWAVPVQAAIQRDLAGELDRPSVHALAVEDDGRICAVCSWIEAAPDKWKVDLVGTSVSDRERGYATELMTHVLKRAVDAGVEALHAEVDIDNWRMRRLVKDLGAQEHPDYGAKVVFVVFRFR